MRGTTLVDYTIVWHNTQLRCQHTIFCDDVWVAIAIGIVTGATIVFTAIIESAAVGCVDLTSIQGQEKSDLPRSLV